MRARINATIVVEDEGVEIEVKSSASGGEHIVWLGANSTLIFSLAKLVELHEKIGALIESVRAQDCDGIDVAEVVAGDWQNWVYPPERVAV